MKKIILLLSILCFSSMLLAEEDEIRDFGIRIGGGLTQGIDNTILPEISAYADMYLLSQSLRMIFGFSIYDTDKTDLPKLSVQSVGVEQNFQLGPGELFLGVLYSKSYLSRESKKFEPQRGETFQTGYKYPLKRYQDLVLSIGQQYKPVEIKNNSSDIKLDDKMVFARLAMQWYF